MSNIEWTDATWNPVTGCDKVSPGCGKCYAKEFAPRLRAMAQARGTGKWLDVNDGTPPTSGPAFGVTLHPQILEQPLRWRKPRKIFVCSMADLFHPEVPDDYIRRVFNTMRSCDGGVTVATGHRRPRHTFQVLTKRPERMAEMAQTRRLGYDPSSPPENIWLGTSIELRTYVGRADHLRETPAAVRFISAEPLLGPLVPGPGETMWKGKSALDLTGIDWLIVGGESGKDHRPMDPQWVRDLRNAIFHDHNDVVGLDRPKDLFPGWALRGTAFFFKQWGGRTPKAGGRELDGRTWDEFPTSTAEAATA